MLPCIVDVCVSFLQRNKQNLVLSHDNCPWDRCLLYWCIVEPCFETCGRWVRYRVESVIFQLFATMCSLMPLVEFILYSRIAASCVGNVFQVHVISDIYTKIKGILFIVNINWMTVYETLLVDVSCKAYNCSVEPSCWPDCLNAPSSDYNIIFCVMRCVRMCRLCLD